MYRKKQTFSFIACMVVLLLTGCGPGPGVYEGPLRLKTSAELKEGNEYLVFFEDDDTKASMWPGGSSSTSASARGYPTLDAIVALYDQMGNTIPNMISSGELQAYFSSFLGSGTCGITVARFRLEGKATRYVEIHANLYAYREFANLYNKRHDGTFGHGGPPGQTYIKPWAPRQPYKIVIRDAGRVSLYPAMYFVAVVIFGIAVIAYVVYKKRQASRTGRP